MLQLGGNLVAVGWQLGGSLKAVWRQSERQSEGSLKTVSSNPITKMTFGQ